MCNIYKRAFTIHLLLTDTQQNNSYKWSMTRKFSFIPQCNTFLDPHCCSWWTCSFPALTYCQFHHLPFSSFHCPTDGASHPVHQRLPQPFYQSKRNCTSLLCKMMKVLRLTLTPLGSPGARHPGHYKLSVVGLKNSIHQSVNQFYHFIQEQSYLYCFTIHLIHKNGLPVHE